MSGGEFRGRWEGRDRRRVMQRQRGKDGETAPERVQAIRDEEDRDTWRQGKGLRDIECGSDREPQKDPTRNTES